MTRIEQAHATLSRSLERTPIRLALFAVMALAASWSLLSTTGSFSIYRDAQFLFQYEEAARRSVLDFGQFPRWDPYYCGGLDLLGTPQSRYVSPTFLLSLLFGTARAESLTAFAMMLLGLEGAYRYARHRGASAEGATMAAPIFALSGMFAAAPAIGWFNFFGFELLPWIALGFRTALAGSARGVVLGAGAYAWMTCFGGTYATPLTALWLLAEIIDFAVQQRKRPAVMKVAAIHALAFGALYLSLAAIRLLPILQTLELAPRVIGGTPGHNWTAIHRALTGRIHPDAGGDFPDDGVFLVGAFIALPLVLGLVQQRSRALVVMGAAWLCLATGYGTKPSLFGALRLLPVYETLRFPERFLILFALVAAVLAARGLTTPLAQRGTKGQLVWPIAFACLVFNITPLVRNHVAAAKGRPIIDTPVRVVQDFHQARGSRWVASNYSFFDRGCLSCFDAYPVPQSALLRGDLTEEEYLKDEHAGTVKRIHWSPNQLDLQANVASPTRLYVNQNWHPGWRSNVGEVVSEKGLLAVDLPAGQHAVRLTFMPRAFVAGAAGSIAALLVIGFLLSRKRIISAPIVLLACAAPLVPIAIAWLACKEPAPPPVELRNQDGEPIVLESPPPAQAIGARFTAGVSLVGARLLRASDKTEVLGVLPAGERLLLEVQWKTDASVEKRLGIFVHLSPTKGDELRADHVMLSDRLLIERAPHGPLLRDSTTISLPPDARGKTWKVYVGLWRVLGDGSRVSVANPAEVTTDENRVLVGSFRVE